MKKLRYGRLGNLSKAIRSGRTDARTQVFWLQILCPLASGVNLLSLSSEPTPRNGGRSSPNSVSPSPLATGFLLGCGDGGHLGQTGRWEEGERGFLPSSQVPSALLPQQQREGFSCLLHSCCQHQPCSDVPAAARLPLDYALSCPGPSPWEHPSTFGAHSQLPQWSEYPRGCASTQRSKPCGQASFSELQAPSKWKPSSKPGGQL